MNDEHHEVVRVAKLALAACVPGTRLADLVREVVDLAEICQQLEEERRNERVRGKALSGHDSDDRQLGLIPSEELPPGGGDREARVAEGIDRASYLALRAATTRKTTRTRRKPRFKRRR